MEHKSFQAIKALAALGIISAIPMVASAQNRTVHGVVTDAEGPVIGATMKIKGTGTGTVTDLDGKYTLSVPAGATIEVSYVGYNTQYVKVGRNAVYDVTLSQDAKQLSEVVVVGYGTMKRSDLTGAVTSVGSKSIEKSIPTSIDQVLAGRAAGVQVQANTGTPGGSSTIRIRGTNSLNATSQPIFVIDGVIIDASAGDEGNTNPLASINPNDIVSMDILKDASATAIYGSRASNGVIMITTRRGQAGEATINYDGYVGWQTMPQKLDVMNLQQYAQHYNDIAAAQIKDPVSSFVRPELLGSGTDWQDELYRHALMTSHNLSISGGNQAVTYAFSTGYLDQDGIAIGSSFKRQTMRGNIDAQIKKWLKGGVSFSLADSKQNTLANSYGIILTALSSQPSVAVRNPDGVYDGPDDQWMPDNPVALAEITTNYNKKQNFRTNAYLEAKIIKEMARKYLPAETKLFVNDYNLEVSPGKLQALVKFVENIDKANGSPIVDGIGSQVHFDLHAATDNTATNDSIIKGLRAKVDAMFKALAATGKLVRVTELDVSLGTSSPSAAQYKCQSDCYKMIFESYKANIPEAQQSGITIWSLSDNEAEHEYWLKGDVPNIFDASYLRKWAYKGVCDGIAGEDLGLKYGGEDYKAYYEKQNVSSTVSE